MADCVATGDSSLYVLPLIKDRIGEYICKKCSAYESQLKEVLEELESAKTINTLQRELPTNMTPKNTCGEQTNTKEWTSVSSRNNSARQNKNNLCEPKTTDQHIVTTNRFIPLYKLQANNVESNGLQTLHDRKSRQDKYQHKTRT
jgi:hypothetical protein